MEGRVVGRKKKKVRKSIDVETQIGLKGDYEIKSHHLVLCQPFIFCYVVGDIISLWIFYDYFFIHILMPPSKSLIIMNYYSTIEEKQE